MKIHKSGGHELDRLRLALVLFALTHFLVAAEVPSKLVGRWRSLEASQGGIGAMLEFHADGSVDFSPGAVVESAYRIEGNQLILPAETKSGPEQKSTFEFVGDDKLRLSKAGVAGELTRRGAPTDPFNLIIGEWNGTRDINGHQVELTWLFYPNGKTLLLIPFNVEHGHFTVEGANIRFELPRQKLLEGHFDVDGDVLKLPGKKTVSPYARY
jgi:hypothetical protein